MPSTHLRERQSSNQNNDKLTPLPIAINSQLQLHDNAIADFSLDLPVHQQDQEEDTYLAPIQMRDLDSYLCTERQPRNLLCDQESENQL